MLRFVAAILGQWNALYKKKNKGNMLTISRGSCQGLEGWCNPSTGFVMNHKHFQWLVWQQSIWKLHYIRRTIRRRDWLELNLVMSSLLVSQLSKYLNWIISLLLVDFNLSLCVLLVPFKVVSYDTISKYEASQPCASFCRSLHGCLGYSHCFY